MNPNEQKLQYPWADFQPEAGRAHQVAEGVKWIRMPLPFALDHINLWLLRDRIDGRDGWNDRMKPANGSGLMIGRLLLGEVV